MPTSPEFLDSIAEAALDAVVLVDDEGVIRGFNAAATSTFGYTEHEALGSRMQDLMIPPRLREAHEAEWKRHQDSVEKRSPVARGQIQAMRKNGEEFPVDLTVTAMQMEESRVYLAFVRDRSEAKRAADQLAMAQFAVDSTADAVMFLENETEISYANRQASHFADVEDGKLVGKNLLEFHPDIVPED